MFGNWIKTAVLMAAMVALGGLLGMALGGAAGMLLGLALTAAANLWAYWNSDRLVLRLYRAQEVDAASAPALYRLVAELAARAGLPMPRVYLIEADQPNAFATGRDPQHAAVAVTTGLLQLLSGRELRGVLAHELAHIRHRDTLLSTLSATMAGAISTVAQFGVLFSGRDERGGVPPVVALLLLIVAPVAASLIQMAISRTREFEADRAGAEISGDPAALASALRRIDAYARGLPLPVAEAHPETAQLMVVNPLVGGGLAKLFATHPPVEERVARLLVLARGGF